MACSSLSLMLLYYLSVTVHRPDPHPLLLCSSLISGVLCPTDRNDELSLFLPSWYLFRWLIYEEPGFQGVPFILEPGEYPDLSFWDTEEAYIGSMRPLKMVKMESNNVFLESVILCLTLIIHGM